MKRKELKWIFVCFALLLFAPVVWAAQAPTITSISPTTGHVNGGTNAFITGTNFAPGATVTFGGAPGVVSTLYVSSTIVVTVPAHSAGVVDVVVTNPDGLSATLNNGYTYSGAAPSITKISPTTGHVNGGTSASITGTNFAPGATVTFGGAPSVVSAFGFSSTSLMVTVPGHSVGVVDVVVTNPDGLSATLNNGYTYSGAAPTVTSISPTTGHVNGGTSAFITGTNFAPGATVTFGGAPGVVSNSSFYLFGGFSSTSLMVTVPGHSAGVVDVVVTNPDGLSATLNNGYTYSGAAPSITKISPTTGHVNGGTSACITGTNFAPGATVTFGGAPGVVSNFLIPWFGVSSTSIVVTVPAHSAGVVDVVVTNPDGLSATLNNGYTYSTPISSNSIGPRNTIKFSDMSGTLPAGGAVIAVSAWDVNGNVLPESSLAVPLKLYNYETTSIAGSDLAARFLNGSPMLYKFDIGSSKVVITNVKISTDGTFKVPIVYENGVATFVSNAIGNYNTIKISDISGTLPAGGGAITVLAWDANGNALPESLGAAPLILYNNGTTSISGASLAARFPAGSPMIYEFEVPSEKVLITNVKRSTDGKLNVPIAYTSGVSNFVSNSIGSYNTLEISDLSGTLPFGGGVINVLAWDVSGKAITESGSAEPLMINNHGTTSISGSDLAARFPTGSPMTYKFFIESSKVLITNVKSSTDGLVEIPSIFTSGISNYATNYVSSLSTIKISDISGTLPASGVAIRITAWDSNGNEFSELPSVVPLRLFNFGTTSISGSDLAARFPSGFPVLYEFSIGSSNAIVTSLTTSIDGTIKTPTVFNIGPYGGI